MLPSDGKGFGNLTLRGLQEVAVPDSVHYLPLAPGWYVVASVLAIVLGWKALQLIKHYRANAYRRDALKKQRTTHQQYQSAKLSAREYLQLQRQILKATALKVYPRSEVAQLDGDSWQKFLNSKTKTMVFSSAQGQLLGSSSYQRQFQVSDKQLTEFADSVARWIKEHRGLDGVGA